MVPAGQLSCHKDFIGFLIGYTTAALTFRQKSGRQGGRKLTRRRLVKRQAPRHCVTIRPITTMRRDVPKLEETELCSYAPRHNPGGVYKRFIRHSQSNTWIRALSACFILSTPSGAEDFTALIAACADGNMEICVQLEGLSGGSPEPSSRLDARAVAFQQRAPSLKLDGENTPELAKAYPLVVRDFFSAKTISAGERGLFYRPAALPECAQHYHETWLYDRGWWPVGENGKPDWRLIYPHILDHYFGYCVKTSK